jgi:hypothetical protein
MACVAHSDAIADKVAGWIFNAFADRS